MCPESATGTERDGRTESDSDRSLCLLGLAYNGESTAGSLLLLLLLHRALRLSSHLSCFYLLFIYFNLRFLSFFYNYIYMIINIIFFVE